MMVMVAAGGTGFGMTMGFTTVFAGGFQFQCRVVDAVFSQFSTDVLLHVVGITIGDDVHSSIVAVAVHTPDVNVVDILYSANFAYMFLKLVDTDAGRRLFQKNIQAF